MKPAPRAIAAVLIALACAPAASANAQARPASNVGRVPVVPTPLESRDSPSARGDRHACIEAGRIRGATVLGDRTIEVSMENGERLHMSFAADCPFLGFYQGFYYRRTEGGKLCAGRDSVIDRSGGACFIQEIRRHRVPKP